MALSQNFSSREGDTAYQTAIDLVFTPLTKASAHSHLNNLDVPTSAWRTTTESTIILALSLFLMYRMLSSLKSWNSEPAKRGGKRPSRVPYSIPILGNLPKFLYAPQDLARQISYVAFSLSSFALLFGPFTSLASVPPCLLQLPLLLNVTH